MSTINIIHNYQLPKIYRILVIDDKIGKNIAFQNCFRACIEAGIKNKGSDYDVLIDFNKTVDEGFRSWIDNSYDLVLIDYDFSRLSENSEEFNLSSEFNLYSIFPERQGLELLRFILQLIDKAYNYKKSFQKIYLWTSHRYEKDDGKGVISELKEEEKIFFLSKNNKDAGKDNKKLDEIIDVLIKGIKPQEWKLEYTLERLVSLSLYAKGKYNLKGYVAYNEENNGEGEFYPPLIEGSKNKLYLLPNKPDQDKVHWCSLDELQIKKKEIRKLDGNEFLKFLKKRGESVKKDPSIQVYHAFDVKNIKDLKGDEYKKFASAEGIKRKNTDFAGIKFDSDIWLAATPLTSVTRIGKEKDIFQLFKDKLEAFFKMGIGAAVLKTTYWESKDIKWPKDHIQRFHRTRVFNPGELEIKTEELSSDATIEQKAEIEKLKIKDIKTCLPDQLWNTGKTALETFTPKMLHKFLEKLQCDNSFKNRIIVSLGCTKASDWENLFEAVFGGLDGNSFQLVEINTRHSLRPIIKESISGDEYLSPCQPDRFNKDKYQEFSDKYVGWIKMIHELGKNYTKKIILKYPFRTDIIALLKIAEMEVKSQYKNTEINWNNHFGISGVTLINTFKSSYPEPIKETIKDLAKYDSLQHLQMSGELLSWVRNFVISRLDNEKFDLPVSASGGVGSTDADLAYCRQFKCVKSLQIGTLFLKKITTNTNRQLFNYKKPQKNDSFLEISENKEIVPRIVSFKIKTCVSDIRGRCGNCYNSYYCDVFLNRGEKNGVPIMDVTACTGCGLCVQNCPTKALAVLTADEYIILCCPHSESRSIILRERRIPFINLETPSDVYISKRKMTTLNINHNEEISKLIAKIKDDIVKEALMKAYWRAYYQYWKCQKPTKDKNEVIPLENCIYLGVKTYLRGKQMHGNGFEVLEVLKTKKAIEESLKKYETYQAITAYVCVKKGMETRGAAIYENEFTIKKDFIENHLKDYSSYGIGKLGGIDILGHGEILFKKFSTIEKRHIYTFAGLPMEAIETIENLREK